MIPTATPQEPQKAVYVFLEPGDDIRKGDEYWFGTEWRETSKIGDKVYLGPYRRRVDLPEKLAEAERELAKARRAAQIAHDADAKAFLAANARAEKAERELAELQERASQWAADFGRKCGECEALKAELAQLRARPVPADLAVKVRALLDTYHNTGCFSTGLEFVHPKMRELEAALETAPQPAEPSALQTSHTLSFEDGLFIVNADGSGELAFHDDSLKWGEGEDEKYRSQKLLPSEVLAIRDWLNRVTQPALSPSEFRKSRPDLDFADPNQHAAIALAYSMQQYTIGVDLAEPQPAEKPHNDDVSVDRFTSTMKAKLAKKRAEGWGGWQTTTAEFLSKLLREHVEKGDPVDVANLAMMLHQNGQRIVPQPAGTDAEIARLREALQEIADLPRPKFGVSVAQEIADNALKGNTDGQ